MKFLLYFMVGMGISTNLIAQSANSYLNNYVQPAPNAASLGKYADYPVSYYTGVPQIGVPLYTLSDGAINLPISLSYHASGIRVSENASWVGLGWALNAGGVITRTVRGAPDEGTRQISTIPNLFGYYASNGIRNMPLLPYPGESSSLQVNFSTYFIPAVTTGSVDTEPDIFTFNFNGYTGKFVFDEYQVPHLLTDDNLKISVDYSNGSFNSWKIITPDGVQYNFGENNTNEVTYPHSTLSGEGTDGQAPSSWYLTSINNPNTKDFATFSYIHEYYNYRDLGPETHLFGPANPNDVANACDLSGIPLNMITTSVYGLRLTGIQTKNYLVKFIGSNIRQDLRVGTNNTPPAVPVVPGVQGSYSLDAIQVFQNATCVKQIALAYDYFVSPVATAPNIISLLNSGGYGNDISDTKRLKLVSVTEIDCSGSIKNPPYEFSYNEAQVLPRRLSFDQDHWGFYNNDMGYDYRNTFFTPTVTAGYCTVVSQGANRDSKWPYMSGFILTGIKNPIGATTVFQYQPNSYGDDIPASKTLVGGVRVSQIQATDNVTGAVYTRAFNYFSGGILYHDPRDSYLKLLNNEYYNAGGSFGQLGGYQGYSTVHQGDIYDVLREAQSIVPLQDPQGNHIGYPFVKEMLGTSGENGYKVYRFSVNTSPNSNSSRIAFDKYTAVGTIMGVSGYFGSGLFNEILPQNLVPYYAPYSTNYYYPLAPQQLDITRGNLLTVATYSASNVLLDSLTNLYDENLHEDYWIRGFKAHRSSNVNSTGNTYNRDALTFYKLHTGISHLIATSKIRYLGGLPVTEYTIHGYESPNHTLKTSDNTTKSNGDIVMNKYYYSFDYATAADDVFSKMKAMNLLLPVSTHTWKNGNLISGNITRYYDFAASGTDILIKPQKVYALETMSPLTAVQANESVNWVDQQTALLPNVFFKERANFTYDGITGKAVQQQLTNGEVESYLWDYNNTYPIAEAKNADALSIAYTSFEADGSGNWTISAAARDNSQAITGNISYVLSNGNVSKAGLTAAKTYVVSYWTLNSTPYTIAGTAAGYPVKGVTNKGWTYYEHHVTGQTTITVSGTGNIDELRLYPLGAQLTTYTYDPATGLTSITDAKNETTYYEYDPFQRLMNIKDKDGNIVKHTDYHYHQ